MSDQSKPFALTKKTRKVYNHKSVNIFIQTSCKSKIMTEVWKVIDDCEKVDKKYLNKALKSMEINVHLKGGNLT